MKRAVGRIAHWKGGWGIIIRVEQRGKRYHVDVLMPPVVRIREGTPNPDLLPVPPELVRAATRELFPGKRMTEAERLAAVGRAFGESWAQHELKQAIDNGHYDLPASFSRAWRDAKHRPASTYGTLAVWLLTAWPMVALKGNTTAIVYAQLGYSEELLPLDTFRRYLRRLGASFGGADKTA